MLVGLNLVINVCFLANLVGKKAAALIHQNGPKQLVFTVTQPLLY